MPVSVGNRNTIMAGQIILGPEETTAQITDDQVRIRLVFSDEPNQEPKVDTIITGDNYAQFTFFGFNNSLGTAFKTTLKSSGIDHQCKIVVHAIGNETPIRMISYMVDTA